VPRLRKDEKLLSEVMIKKNCHKEKNGKRRNWVVIFFVSVGKNLQAFFFSKFEGNAYNKSKII
jgi:hypothetical protein